MNEHEHKWIETNNAVCALLKEAHDALALNSLPPKRRWAGLTEEEIGELYRAGWTNNMDFARAIEAKLKEKNRVAELFLKEKNT
jgi:hypothetical protein